MKTRLDNEIQQLVKDIWRVGDPLKPQVPFGELFDDDDVQQHYEGLAATLKAAKKREFGPSCNTTSRRLFYLLFYVFSFFLSSHPMNFAVLSQLLFLVGDDNNNFVGGIVTYQSPILLKGAHDKVMVNLVDTSPINSTKKQDDLDELKNSGVNANLNISQS